MPQNEKDLQVVYRNPSELIPYARNARTHNPEQVQRIAASIREFGFTSPILLDGNNGILAGHGRLAAAMLLKLDRVPTIDLKGLSQAQQRAYILADNRLALDAGWDEQMLAVELGELSSLDYDLSFTGFTEDEIEGFLTAANSGAEDEGADDPADEAPEPPDEPITQRGDVWILGAHRLMCGDSTSRDDVQALLQGAPADLCLTDPPYGVSIVKRGSSGDEKQTLNTLGDHARPLKFKGTTNRWDNPVTVGKGKTKRCEHLVAATEYYPIIGDESTETARKSYEIARDLSGIQVIFGGNYFTDFLPPSRWWFVWDKGVPDGTPFAQCELAWVSKDANAHLFKRQWSGLCREGSREVEGVKRIHPTQKPVSLMEDILGMYPKALTVMDLFGGSGSTLIACERQGRKCRMMEMSERYCDVIVKRWQDLTGGLAVRESDGAPFDPEV